MKLSLVWLKVTLLPRVSTDKAKSTSTLVAGAKSVRTLIGIVVLPTYTVTPELGVTVKEALAKWSTSTKVFTGGL